MQLKAPITYNIYDGNKLVFKTKSATKASDYRVTNGKHLSIMAIDSIGNTKKLYADGGMVESKINELYKKSKFINDDFNWKLKLLEMIQDNSIEAYNIYQTLSNEEKEQVLQEQYEVDNDMGSDGDGKLKTTKENLSILLRGAKNGKKYGKGSTVKSGYSQYRVEGGDMDLSLKDKMSMYSWIDSFLEKYSGDDNFSQSLDMYKEFAKKFGKNKEQTHDIIDGGWARSRGYANGGGVGILEQRIALAKKKSKVAKDGKFFGSEVYLVLQHKTDPEEIFVISQFNYNIDRHNNQWNDYNIVFKTNEYANGGILNGNYLDTISNDKKNEILKNIANHYGISVAEAKAEVIDADAEMLYEYIANDKSLKMSVYNDFEYGKFADGGGVGEYGAYKVTFQDDVEDMLTWSEYAYANSEQQAISRSAESLNRKYPKYDFSKMKVVEVEEGDKYADGGNTSSEYSYSIGGL